MDRRIALVVVLSLAGCFEEPPDASQEEAGADADADADAGADEVSIQDACVELLVAAAAADCDRCDYSYCSGAADGCTSFTEGEIVDACSGLEVAPSTMLARSDVDACLADASVETQACTAVGSLCSHEPNCSEACDRIGIFEACYSSPGCIDRLCG